MSVVYLCMLVLTMGLFSSYVVYPVDKESLLTKRIRMWVRLLVFIFWVAVLWDKCRGGNVWANPLTEYIQKHPPTLKWFI